MFKNENIEISILHCILLEDMPIGAVVISEKLEENGFFISETGVGRLLRLYRKNGFLEKIGNRGHILTESGRLRLKQLYLKKELHSALEDLIGSEGPHNNFEKKESIQGVLVARRAIEVEGAFRAALNATSDEIESIGMIIKKQYEDMESNKDYTSESTNFHKAVLKASKIPMLETLYRFIGISTQWQNFFIGTFKLYNTPINLQHEMIFDAIKERNPQKASAVMALHMDSVIENAKKLLLL